MSTEPAPPWLRKVGMIFLIVWGAIFLLGAAGELLGIEWLQRITDFKRIFLR